LYSGSEFAKPRNGILFEVTTTHAASVREAEERNGGR
jgi:hypothetical protein